jgi:tetratricopeptide (TPR) repeat protein
VRPAAAVVLVLAAAAGGCRSDGPAGRSAFAVADSLLAERRFAQAHPHFRRLRDSLAVTADTAGWWKAQLWWAQTLMRLGRTDSSEVAIRDALTLAGADRSRRGWTLWLRCGLSSRLGRFDAAVADCAQAIDLAVAAGDGELEARVHFALGTIYSRRALYRRSVAETERALALERVHGRTPQQLAGVLNSMGIEYAAVGRLSDAAAAYEEGLALARKLADTSTTAVLISNLAALRSYTGRLDLAIDLMTESLRSARALADSSSIGYALTSLGDYYRRVGERAQARVSLTEALAISSTQMPAVQRVGALLNLGLVDLADGSVRAGRATLEQALPLADQGGFGLERFEIHLALSRLAIGRRDLLAARRSARAARAIADSLGSPDVELRALELEGLLREAEGRVDAPPSFLAAIDLLESWRGRLALGDLRLGLAEPRWSVYEGAVRTLLARGQVEEAFLVTERARARRLLEVLAERNPGPESSPAAALTQRLRERFEERSGVTDSAARALDREIAALTDSIRSMEADDPTRHPRPASLERIRATLLSERGSAVLSVFWGDSAVYGWWLTSDTVVGSRLGSATALGPPLDFLRDAVVRRGPDPAWRAPAHRVYRDLLSGFDVSGATAIFALVDGPLARVPLEVLLPSPIGLPLGATHRIQYGPSASVLAALAAAPQPTGWARAVLAVGNPSSRAGPARPRPPDARSESRPELPFAEREARGIVELHRGGGADLLIRGGATVERWLAQRPERYRYLHFAAHARADDREPEGSRLFLADRDLDLPAIRRLSLTADLVTLSACETALGRQVRGEGVIGLAQAFLMAGARRTVVTLWSVADRTTADFMIDFYRELGGGTGPAAALTAVRRRWIEANGSGSHPASWAPFILLGEGSR